MEEQMTPMMKQYMDVKNEYKDSLLFYRIGDFYEMFFDDALTASKELEITLTGKDCGMKERAPMCGVPYHSVTGYIAKLIGKGYKVAICEQLEDPSLAKGLVKRNVTRVITPGTVIESNMLDDKKNNYIAAIYRVGVYYGFAYSDVSTGEFCTTEAITGNNFSKILDEIARVMPAEIVVNQEMAADALGIKTIQDKFNSYITIREPSEVEIDIQGFSELDKLVYAKDATRLLLLSTRPTYNFL